MSAVDGSTEEDDVVLVAAQDPLRGRDKDAVGRDDADLGFVELPRDGRSVEPRAVPTFGAVVLEPPFEAMPLRRTEAGDTVSAPPADLPSAQEAMLVPAPTPAVAAPRPFAVGSGLASAASSTTDIPWTVRATAAEAEREVSRRGWTTRQTGEAERLLGPVLLRLREEAVEVSWRAAWAARAAATRPAATRPAWHPGDD